MTMPPRLRRPLLVTATAALAGAALPVSAGAPASAGDTSFSGFSASAWAAPVRIEVYEPTIPIPADPQLEVELAYTLVESDSGSSAGRASWLWPGDPVGEGMKTFVEQLGLPPQLGENGYPVQVNAASPSGEHAQEDEPFPGAVMRTRAGEGTTIAQAGFSPDGEVGDGADRGGPGDEGAPGVPELPGLPGLPGSPGSSGLTADGGLEALQQLGQAITGSTGSTVAAGDPAPGLPPELAALVDVEGYTSSSRSVVTGSTVATTARSALGTVSLLGGIVELDGVVVTSSSSSDGAKGRSIGRATLGGLRIAGQEFSFGPDGFEAAGRRTDIPGLPDQAAAALERLGVRLVLPKPERTAKGDRATADLAGLRVELDLSALRSQLDALPLDDLIGAVPAQAGELKTLLQTVAGLSPRVVLTLGNASTAVDTVQGLEIPGGEATVDAPGAADGAGGGAGGGGNDPADGSAAPPAPAPGPAPDAAPSADGPLSDVALTGSGLPPLYSIPGAILVGGIALAAVGGTWLRRAGALALGGAGSCSHGLDSGLPDLRKA